MQQNTEEWRNARAGKITASMMKAALAFDPGGSIYKSGPKKGQERPARSLQARTDYIYDIVAEILTGQAKEPIRAKALDWGHDVESAARAEYEVETAQVVQVVGFVTHPVFPFIGCSPDGLVGTQGLTQIKCPADSANHIITLETGMPEEHIPQVQGEMFVTDRVWSDFVSFDPRMPPGFRFYRQRIMRDESYIAELSKACLSLWDEVQEKLHRFERIAA